MIAAERRLFWRAARFLCTMFLSAMESITGCDSLNTACAAALSPASIALRTFLIAVRKVERRLML